MWRQFFESLCHEENCFVTLTYNDQHLPDRGSLVPSHLRDFIKRLRFALAPKRIRFFAVGEYGDGSGAAKRDWNPHYHISVFGLSGTSVRISRNVVRHYGGAKAIDDSWQMGDVYVAEFNEKTAQYVAGYTTKKLTTSGDPKLGGRYPEFMRSSRRPGLGTEAMAVVAKQLLSNGGLVDGDVPPALKLGKKSIPLGRFLLNKARLAAGMTDHDIKTAKERNSLKDGRFARSVELRDLFLAAIEDDPAAPITPTQLHTRDVAQRVLQAEKRYAIWSKKKESL